MCQTPPPPLTGTLAMCQTHPFPPFMSRKILRSVVQTPSDDWTSGAGLLLHVDWSYLHGGQQSQSQKGGGVPEEDST